MRQVGLRELAWLVCGVIVAVASYLVTTKGASERARLHSLDVSIVEARKQIRDLETEFDARASMAQLGDWNARVLGLSAPAASQYLPDPEALASYDANGLRQTASEKQLIPAGLPAGTDPAQPVAMAQASVPNGNAKTATAQVERDAVAKVRVEAVAMLDDNLVAELRKRAEVEQLALH